MTLTGVHLLVLQRDRACLREGVARRLWMAGGMGTDGSHLTAMINLRNQLTSAQSRQPDWVRKLRRSIKGSDTPHWGFSIAALGFNDGDLLVEVIEEADQVEPVAVFDGIASTSPCLTFRQANRHCVPLRVYSCSRRAGLPGWGGRSGLVGALACWIPVFSSIERGVAEYAPLCVMIGASGVGARRYRRISPSMVSGGVLGCSAHPVAIAQQPAQFHGGGFEGLMNVAKSERGFLS